MKEIHPGILDRVLKYRRKELGYLFFPAEKTIIRLESDGAYSEMIS